MLIKNKQLKRVGYLGAVFAFAFVSAANAAEKIHLSFFLFERSFSIDSLETFAREGRYTESLSSYGRFFNAEQLEQARGALLQKVDLEPLTIAQFLYTPIGERLLKRVSKIVRPKSGIDGFYALRSALIGAASQEGGLTALNVLKQYPTQGIQVDLKTGLDLFAQVQKIVEQTNAVVAEIESEANASAAPGVFKGTGQYLSQPGTLEWMVKSFSLQDDSALRMKYTGQPRTIPVDVYLPQQNNDNKPYPVVVISHGLNSERSSFAYLAEHLASWGYGVIVPEHIGSNKAQIEDLLKGQERDVIGRTEFLDRPLDVKYALDALSVMERDGLKLSDRLDFENVMVLGQSFGGYTALALAGATVNFEQLRQTCATNLDNTFNLSLLLQCLALRVPDVDYQLADFPLKDNRVKAVIAISPIGSQIFGAQGMGQIQVPTMIVGGTADTVSPLLPEQVFPFSWLTNKNKYFVMVNAGTHFSFIDDVDPDQNQQQFSSFLGRSPDVAQTYLKSLSLSFVNTHLRGQSQHDAFLTSEFGTQLSQKVLPLSVVQEFSPEVLKTLMFSSAQPNI